MSAPTTLIIRVFSDHAEALAHCILRAGDAPRLLAYDDTVGCPVEQSLAALEWTRVVGVLPDDDLLHAGRLTSETAAAVVERRTSDGRRWIFLGPRLDAAPVDAYDGEITLDEPGVMGITFQERSLALAHFLRVTAGGGALLAQLGRRAPELRHMRRWLAPIVQELDGPRRLIAGWFAASAGGALFIGEEAGESTHQYIEVGIDS
ncbi:MAG TPA: hypothetical protein VGM77_03680 [Gemmatimonadales bacterium]|jgi:hypothetical protein